MESDVNREPETHKIKQLGEQEMKRTSAKALIQNIVDALEVAPVLINRGAFSKKRLEDFVGKLPRYFERAVHDLCIVTKSETGEWSLQICPEDVTFELAESILERSREINDPTKYAKQVEEESAKQDKPDQEEKHQLDFQLGLFSAELAQVKSEQSLILEAVGDLIKSQAAMQKSINALVEAITQERSHG